MQHQSTSEQFALFMQYMGRFLPKYAPDVKDPVTLKLWHDALSDLNPAGLQDIFKYCRDNLDQFPSIKFIKELVDYGDDGLPPDPFSELISAVQTRRFDRHPAILELARQCGGFQAIGDWAVEYHDAKRRMVDQLWKGILQRWKSGSLEDTRREALPPANVLAVITAGMSEGVKELKSKETKKEPQSLKGWIDEIRTISKSQQKRR